VPQREPGRVFYLADQAFFVEPPLSFYGHALFFAVLPDCYGAARMLSAAAALVSVWLVYELGRALYRSEAAALWGAGLYSLARTFYFPAMMGWPYMLCSAFGLATLLCLLRREQAPNPGTPPLLLAGVLLGLGGLTHYLAIVYALQAAGWLCFSSRGWRRLGCPALVAAIALTVFLVLWLPMIAAFPEAFRGQFLDHWHSTSGIVARMAWPWASLRWHAWIMSEPVGPAQFVLLLGGPALATLLACVAHTRRSESGRKGAAPSDPSAASQAGTGGEATTPTVQDAGRGPLIACALAWSSVFLLATAAGMEPTQHYWCYPTALLCVCLGGAIADVAARLPATGLRRVLVNGTGGALLVALMLPGAGLRTCLAHLRHWNDIDYNAPAFARRMLAELPVDARYTVDRAFVLDFLAAGRRTLLAETFPRYFSAEQFQYDYLIVSRYGLDKHIATTMRGELVRTHGNRDDPFACYAEIYRPADSARRIE
jgi:4-amino-4-deoxy-L-arabinose transferase-like glycosyltransferase